MATLYTQAESNTRKTFLLIGFFLIFIILLGWLFSYLLGSYIILVMAVIFSVAMSFGSYWYSDKLVLRMTKAAPIEKKDNPELYRLVENLCITAGLPLPRIYILPESQPNAFATGRDADHAVVAVTQGLLEKLERTELEGVIAILAPLAATLIRLAISRKREFLADASGALLTRYPEGLARALEKISADPTPLKVANNSTAHLFISSPFRGEESKKWFTGLFQTHPPVEERVEILRGMRVK